MPRANEPAIAMPAIEQMRDLFVMFRNLLYCLLRLPTNPHRAGAFRCSRSFLDASSVVTLPTLRTGQDIGIQRAIARSKPFGAKHRAAATAIVDWQLQPLDQALNLAARGETRCLLHVGV